MVTEMLLAVAANSGSDTTEKEVGCSRKAKTGKMRADSRNYIILEFTIRGRQKQESKLGIGRMPDVTLAG